ncbi:MAG TPA: FecR family protein [Flavisolibacter sp.]|jgi:ferric-dicitrate binding protein FerR (iron transport regulator)|nr:FecR family protein [Flavisolibacter sp.]
MSQSLFWNLLAKKIAGEATPQELQELENLMKLNHDWAYQAEHIQQFWQYKTDTGKQESEFAFEQHLQRMKEVGIDFPQPGDFQPDLQINSSGKRKKRIAYSVSIAVGLILLITGMVWLTSHKKKSPFLSEQKFSEVSSPIRSKTKLVLPDSTVVWLNAGSKLTYSEHFGITNRNTSLIGEAFFDVKKGTVPFIIHANKMQIKVLGTAFNVRAYPDEKTTETSLIRGRVEIRLDKKPDRPFFLEPNEKLVVSNEQEEVKTKLQNKDPLVVLKPLTRTVDSTVVETSWVHNELVFQDENFHDIAMKMEKWYGVAIEFRDEKLANERLSGTFTSETIDEALTALQLSTKFHYIIRGNLITITQ